MPGTACYGNIRTIANYNGLASLMGEHEELSISRKFQRLNAKNLMYIQDEILHLDHELHMIESEDEISKDKSRASLLASLFNLKESSGSSHGVQWNKVLELQEKLQSYSKSCMSARVHSQSGPRHRIPLPEPI